MAYLPLYDYLHRHLAYAQARWKYSRAAIDRFRDSHRGETVFCIGTGPSIADEPIELLSNQVVIFVNGAFRLRERFRPRANYWLIQDHRRLYTYLDQDRHPFTASFRSFHTLDFSLRRPPFQRGDILLLPRITYSRRLWPMVEAPGPNFSFDLTRHLGMTTTVIFSAIQLAAFMGAARIALLGVDMNYPPGAAHFYDSPEENNAKLFGTYATEYRPTFARYHELLNADGPRLINCTHNTHEDILPKLALQQLLE